MAMAINGGKVLIHSPYSIGQAGGIESMQGQLKVP
jgi:hypothetical protein